MLDAEGLYDEIAGGINNITASIPDDVKQYLERILDGDIKNALGRLDQPLINPSPLLLWTREVSRHFILYYHYGGPLIHALMTLRTAVACTIHKILYSSDSGDSEHSSSEMVVTVTTPKNS